MLLVSKAPKMSLEFILSMFMKWMKTLDFSHLVCTCEVLLGHSFLQVLWLGFIGRMHQNKWGVNDSLLHTPIAYFKVFLHTPIAYFKNLIAADLGFENHLKRIFLYLIYVKLVFKYSVEV